jgi:hypothetical protein
MSRNEQIGRGLRVIAALAAACVGALGSAVLAAGSAAAPPLILEVGPAELAALQALGPDIRVFTSRTRPLRKLADIRDPGVEVGSADLELARDVMSLLRAGGVRFAGGAYDIMTLAGDNHLPSLFTRRKSLRLFLLRARPDGAEQVIAQRGGGAPVVLQAPGGATTTPAVLPAGRSARGAPTAPRTSFGPLQRVERAAAARHRTWQRAGAAVEQKPARPGHQMVVVHIRRDFSLGVGKVAFLFGSGVVVDPDFSQLVVLAGGRRHTPAAVFADGPTLELAYELPAGARNLILEDGDLRLPLQESVAAVAPP